MMFWHFPGRRAQWHTLSASIFKIRRFKKLLVNHCTVEDLTVNNKKFAMGIEISNDFKLVAGSSSNGCVRQSRYKPCKLVRLKESSPAGPQHSTRACVHKDRARGCAAEARGSAGSLAKREIRSSERETLKTVLSFSIHRWQKRCEPEWVSRIYTSYPISRFLGRTCVKSIYFIG